jgi:hypothetical protein
MTIIKGMKKEFLDWLNECPVQWFLDKQEKDSLTYTFMKSEEGEED